MKEEEAKVSRSEQDHDQQELVSALLLGLHKRPGEWMVAQNEGDWFSV